MDNSVASVLIIAFFASLAPTIAAIAALMAARESVRKVDTNLEKTTEIHTLTNGNLSRVSTELQVANSNVLQLQKQVSMLLESKSVADTVAEVAAKRSAAALTEAQHSFPGKVVADS